jgi:hypothetical protein
MRELGDKCAMVKRDGSLCYDGNWQTLSPTDMIAGDHFARTILHLP